MSDQFQESLDKMKDNPKNDGDLNSVNEIKSGVLRTPDECFENLPDYPFESNYVNVDGLRVHYLDEGPKNADPILLMHGEPSWSYLYRKMIPGLVAAGHRCIAPDLIGFGKSDKLASRNDYSYKFHIGNMNGFVKAIDLKNITLFCQDWGSLIGIRVLIDNLDRFDRLVVANGGLPTGDGEPPEAFKQWLEFSQNVEDFPVGGIINGGCASDLPNEVIAAYDAPFPHDAYKECARIFPSFVPITLDNPESENNKKGWGVLSQWDGPVLTLFSDSDPVTKGGEKFIQKMMPGAKGQPHEIIEGGGHFVQEDKGEVLAEKIVSWLAK
jgi:haloalkane dehalogenase